MKWVVGSVACVMVAWLATGLPADDPPRAVEPDAAVRYRRVYVPESMIARLARGYLPMPSSEFTQRVEALASLAFPLSPMAARIEGARYFAVLHGDELVDGRASLEVVRSEGPPVALPMSGCNLALSNAQWARDEQPAVMGLDPSGRLVAMVPESGTLTFAWSMRAEPMATAPGSRFVVRLPPSPFNQLFIAASPAVDLAAQGGILSQITPDQIPEWPALDTARDNYALWRIEVGGTSEIVLDAMPRAAAARTGPFVVSSQHTRYAIAPSSVEVTAEVQLEIHHAPIGRLVVHLDGPLQPVGVRLAEKDLEWTELPGEAGTDIVLKFPAAVQGAGHTLRIVAIAPSVLDEPWRLPGIAPADVQWREGTVEASVVDDLEIVELVPSGMREIPSGAPPGTESGAMHVMQLFSASAALDVQLRRRKPEVSSVIATNLDTEPATVSAEVAAEFRSRFGRQFVLEADVARGWSVDSLDIEPRSALEDYELRPIGDRQLLHVKLAEPVTPQRPIRLFMTCHRGGSTTIDLDFFRPVVFRNLENETRIVAIKSDTLYQLDLSGDAGLARLDPETLPGEYASLIQVRGGSVVFIDDTSTLRLSAQLRRQNPEYRVEIEIDASVSENVLTETYRIACSPESSRLDRLTVQLTGNRSDPIDWQLVAPATSTLQARLIEPGDETAAAPEVWELVLGQPTDRPFECVGVRQSSLGTTTDLALASIPAALAQTGVVAVRTTAGTEVQIQPRDVKPIPVEPASPGSIQLLRGRYRYDPSKDASIRLSSRRVDVRNGAYVWAWSGELTTRVDVGGRLWHEAVYRLENTGVAQVVFTLAPDAQIHGVDVNQAPVTTRATTDGQQEFAVALPAGRYPTVRVRYSTGESVPALAGIVNAALPDSSFAVLERRWTVWLPPGYRYLDERRASWSRRLFGPFGRSDPQQLGPPRIADDLAQWNLARPASVEAVRRARETMLRIGDMDATGTTWREVLARISPDAGAAELFVDGRSLAASGVAPNQEIQFGSESSPMARGHHALRSAGLVLLAGERETVLTCRAALDPARTTRVSDVIAIASRSGPVDPDMTARLVSPAYQAATAWIAEPEVPPDPWIRGSDEELSSGWSVVRLDLGSSAVGQVEVYRADALDAMTWSAMIFVAGLGIWTGRRHPQRVVAGVTALAVAALPLPASLAPLLTGALWGAILGGVSIAVFQPRRDRRGGDASSARTTVTYAAGSGAIGLLVAALASLPLESATLADDDPPREESWVLIPVDDARNVVGNHYYLPLDLYDRLHRPGGQPGAWLIRSAAYRTDLTWDLATGTQLESRELYASFRLEVFQPNQTVVIPLGGPNTHVIGARLSGIPVLPVQPAPNQLAIAVGQAGSYQLDVVLQPAPTSDAGTSTFELEVPPVNHALVRIGFPEDAGGIELPTARGQRRIDPFTGELVYDHGPASRLRVQWPANPDSAPRAPETRVDQLLWMHVRPNSVTVEARFNIAVLDGELSRVSVVTDPRLRLIPLTADQPVSSVRTTTGDRQTIAFEFATPVTQSVSLQAEFLVAGASGIGKLHLPSIEIAEVRPLRQWLAVSVADELDFTAENANLSDTLERADFMAAWGPSPLAPVLTYRLPDEPVAWSLLTQPKQQQTTSMEMMDVRVGADGLDLVFRADLNTTNGSVFQHHLKAFESLRIHRASVTLGETEIRARLAEARPGEYQLFLGREITGPYRLTLLAKVPWSDASEALSIPTIRIRRATIQQEHVRIYQRPGVRVSVTPSTGWLAQPDPSADGHREGLGRLVAQLDATPDALGSDNPAGTLRIRPNRPRIDALVATQLDRVSDRWTATTYFRITNLAPEGGIVDQVRLEVPTEWDGPVSVEPQAKVEVVPIPGRSRKHVILMPDQPITDQALLVIRGTLSTETAQRVRAPDIVPLDVVSSRRFLILPAQLQEQKIEWETSGLQETGIPSIVGAGEAGGDRFTAYRIMRAANPRASIVDVQRVSGEPQISLADIRVTAHEDGSCFGVAKFDLEPAGASRVEIDCPQGIELVHTASGEIPVVCEPVGGGRYQMALSADQLPQRIVVVFRGRTRRVGASRQFRCPVVSGFPVVRTLWTVHAPSSWEVTDKNLAQHVVSPLRQDAIRLKTTSELVDAASRTVMESPPREIASWYVPWARRIRVLEGTMARHRAETPSADPLDLSIMEVVSQQQAAIASRLKTTELREQLVGGPRQAAGPADHWDFPAVPHQTVTCCAFLDSVSQLTLDEPDRALGGLARRSIAAVLVVAGMSLCTLILSMTRVGPWLADWPHVAGIGLGVAWWCVLSPGVAGLIVAGVGLLGMVRQALARSRA